RSVRCQANSPMRTLDRLDVTRTDDLIEIRATAQSFLHNQIRSFAGTRELGGEGRMTPGDVQAAHRARDRAPGGPVAPPEGGFFCLSRAGDGVRENERIWLCRKLCAVARISIRSSVLVTSSRSRVRIGLLA
ncbi:MAG: hypothetical protein K0M47_14680, partial [Rhizobium sp.]|nr:hypothetical protein [Rhizobium sp.]